ncbi:2-oxoacid:ferredoxin oxidoreductase subunit alpha [Candidatus Woesearchaeota archaeon CG10_big_fil_rev_8_21_14_0_10_34_8]|nr:MAG: 2-oxoacid:ferredoxin oxidoreductase subunit alpha [Candidatus Woesearchaeota archaeon CG10_big_fil_rev_8_21_14_0_10_34_8]
MKKNYVNWMIGGQAGFGIMNAGMAFAKSLSRGGLYVFSTSEYPSLIRGGHNTIAVRASDKELDAHDKELNLLVALNKETIDLHKDEVSETGGIIYDSDKIKEEDVKNVKKQLFAVPLEKLAIEAGAVIMRNTVALGASMALIDYDIKMLENVLESIFKKKGDVVINNNKKAAKMGYDYIKKNYNKTVCKIEKVKSPKRMVLNCNDAISMGALRSGLKLFAAYPMTPGSSVLHFMAKYERNMEILVKHTEDELASMNTIIGGGFAGARSMTSTSGGGVALMAEGFGLAGMTETPCVVVNAQRGGPSTGLPTRQEQSDLLFMIRLSQGEFPRIVMAPGDVTEAFFETINVFNLTDKYQVPAIILTDKYNYASSKSVELFDTKNVKIDRAILKLSDAKKMKDYKRYKFTENGVSPRALPGYPNTIFRATGNEHSEYGDVTEDSNNRIQMTEKRLKKEEGILKDIETSVKLHGPKNAELTIVGWGSTKGPILEAIEGLKVNFLQILYPWPFPKKQVENVLKKAKNILLVEGNATGQMGDLIKQQTGISIENKYLKYNGHQFYPFEIKQKVEEVLK